MSEEPRIVIVLTPTLIAASALMEMDVADCWTVTLYVRNEHGYGDEWVGHLSDEGRIGGRPDAARFDREQAQQAARLINADPATPYFAKAVHTQKKYRGETGRSLRTSAK